MAKTGIKWTSKEVMDLKAQTIQRLDRLFASVPSERLAAIYKLLESKPPEGVDLLLHQFVCVLIALEHHAAWGGLSDSDVKKLDETGLLILRGIGINRTTSRLSFMFGELYRAKGAIRSNEGNLWGAAWHNELAKYFCYRPTEEQDNVNALAIARSHMRLGHSSLALMNFAVAEQAGIDSPGFARSLLGKARTLKTSGDFSGSREVWQEILVTFQSLESLAKWEILKIDAQKSLDPDSLISAATRDFKSLRPMLEAKLWAYAFKKRGQINRIAKVDSLRRRFNSEKQEIRNCSELMSAVRVIEDAYDNTLPLGERLEQLGEVLNRRANLEDVETELVLLAAAVRMLVRYSQNSMAQLALSEYRHLSVQLSGGWRQDVLGILEDVNPFKSLEDKSVAPEVTSSRLKRAVTMSGAYSKSLGIMASSRLKRIVASKEEHERLREEERMRLGEEMFKSMGVLKGGMMKMGQLLSFASNYSEAFRFPLEALQSSAEPTNPEVARQIIREDLGGDPDDVFLEWNEEPFAVGSIGQVFYARLHSGDEVAVKVQHPGIVEAFRSDIQNMSIFKPVLKRILPRADIDGLMSDIKDIFMNETDYVNEAKWQQEFHEQFKKDPVIYVPKVYEKFSTQRVLTMEFCRGRSFREFVDDASQEERTEAAKAIGRFVGQAFLKLNGFNADPHPGNYIFTEDKRVVFIDFGCVKRFSNNFMDSCLDVVKSIFENNPEANEKAWRKMNYVATDKFDAKLHWDISRRTMAPLIEDGEVEFSREWLEYVIQVNRDPNPNTPFISPPPESASMLRLAWGVASIFVALNPKANWRQLFIEAVYGGTDKFPGDKSA